VQSRGCLQMKLHHLKEPATKGSENPSPIMLREGFCFVFCTEKGGQSVSSGLAVGHYQLVARHNGFEVS